MESKQGKIFGVGLSKTGTSSLAQALQILGFKTLDNMGASGYVAGDLGSIDIGTVDAHEALTDTPIPSFYRELDARYPGAKFILTVRDRNGWLNSCMKQFSPRFAEGQSEPNKRLFEDLYGTNVFDDAKFSGGYERFVAGVIEYFKDRPQDLLVLNVAAGEGWERLCPFLGRPVPDVPFPKANVTQIRWMKMEDLVVVAEQAGRALLQRYEGTVAPEVPGARRGARGLGFLDRAVAAALGGDATAAAAKAAYKAIVTGLRKLNAEIPILSPATAPPPYSDRRRWNHLWLVDPLDGSEAFAAGRGGFSVNIALIEDGRPIYGVVHAPAKGVTFHGRTGKGAFRQGVDGDAVAVVPARTAGRSWVDAGRIDADERGGSVALALCEVFDDRPFVAPEAGSSMEWRLAAAHAVLAAAGWQLCDQASGKEVSYNSVGLVPAAVGVGLRPAVSDAAG